jgi:HAD superfamily hydrolase (TIGR01509 family)
MSLGELVAAKHPEAWKTFELGRCDEAALCASFFADGRPFDGEALKATMRAAYRYLDGIEELLADLRTAGVPMHALSNYPKWYEMIEERLGLSQYLDWSFVSCKMGVRKPDPEAFVGPARALRVDPSQCLFVDDRAANCEGARAVGMDAIRFTTATDLRRALRQHGIL